MSQNELKIPKKLIEVNLPLDDINDACVREKAIRHGHPSTLHLYWARRPLAAARAILFASLVNDPGYEVGGGFRRGINKKEAQKKREELFDIIRDLVKWENLNNQSVLARARDAIKASWRETCALNANHPEAATLFNPNKFPAFHDPFAGGGAIPLEAQRLGMDSYASDLNPVAVLINKGMIEVPPLFSGSQPIGPALDSETASSGIYERSQGLAEDVRRYGLWVLREAKKRIGDLYPRVSITAKDAENRPALEPLVDKSFPVVAWLWARSVKSPDPRFSTIDVPLTKSFVVCSKKGQEAYLVPKKNETGISFEVKEGLPPKEASLGTTAGNRKGHICLLSGAPITYDYLREEGIKGNLGEQLLCVVADGPKGRIFLSPRGEVKLSHENKLWKSSLHLPKDTRDFRTPLYGKSKFADLFTERQLVSLNCFSDLIKEVKNKVEEDAKSHGFLADSLSLEQGGFGAKAYGEAISLYLSFVLDKCADRNSTICTWDISRIGIRNTFGRQAIPMTWDFAEANILGNTTGSWINALSSVSEDIAELPGKGFGKVIQANAQLQNISKNKVVSTDPPYYNNIGYADLSDFFYVWLRHNVKNIYEDICISTETPKSDELIASSSRQGGKAEAESFFLKGMTEVMQRLADQAHPAFPVTIYYAFKQSETKNGATTNTGWETFLSAVLKAGFTISGTWPLRTESGNRLIGIGTNALASSIVLVCKKKPNNAPIVDKRTFVKALNERLKQASEDLVGNGDRSAIAPVDMSQAIIGPGMEVFSQYKAVLNPDGSPVTVGEALKLINRYLDEDAFDSDTQFCITWFQSHGWNEYRFGEAETLATAKGISVTGLKESGVVKAEGGIVQLIHWKNLPADWNPSFDSRISIWEATHQLIRTLETEGEAAAGALLSQLQEKAGNVRLFCTHMYALCERNGLVEDAKVYNDLSVSWDSIVAQANEYELNSPRQPELDL